jgi:CelD/BcsL family acetyltransferase involved in cellulose biosynthesis
MQVEEVVSSAALPLYRREWRDLLEASPDAEVFQSYEWISSWLDAFWPERPIAFLFVRRAGRLVAVAPLVPDDAGGLGCRRSLVLPVNPHASRSDFLLAADAREALDAVLAHLLRTRRKFRISWRLREGSPVLGALRERAARHGLRVLQTAGPLSPVARLPRSWSEYLASRTAHVRHELGRKRRKLERSGRVELRMLTTPQDGALGFDDLLRVEEGSWKQAAGSAFSADSSVARFYSRLAERCAAAGWLRIHLLCLDGRPVAHVFGLEHAKRYYALKTSYLEELAQASPGSVVFGHALQDACERGVRTFEFLGVESRWKAELADSVSRTAQVCAFTAGLLRCQACALLEERLKPALKEHAPALVSLRRRLGANGSGPPSPLARFDERAKPPSA